MRFKHSVFCSPEFRKLSLTMKSIYLQSLYLPELEALDSAGLDYCATILLRAQCLCKLIDIITDESTGQQYGIARKKHFPDCPAFRIPVQEDCSFATLFRKQKRELLMDNAGLLILEEKSAAVKRR